MDHILNFPSKINLIAYKQPCKNVKVSLVEGDLSFSWESGEKVKINKSELQNLLDDSVHLINNTGLYFYKYFIDKKNDNSNKEQATSNAISCIIDYFTKWGPLINTKENSITFTNLMISTFSVFMCLMIWQNKYGFYNQLCDLLDPQNNKIIIKEGIEKYWYSFPYNLNDNYVMYWVPEYMFKEFNYSDFYLRIKQPSKKEYKVIISKENGLLQFVGDNIFKSISNYIYHQGIKVTNVRIDNECFVFDFVVNNRLLTFLVCSMTELTNTNVSFCKCGCNGLVSGKNKYIQGHFRKAREQKPDRKIKAWLRTKKNRGVIDERRYKSLSKKVDSLLGAGKTEHETKKIIEVLMKEV